METRLYGLAFLKALSQSQGWSVKFLKELLESGPLVFFGLKLRLDQDFGGEDFSIAELGTRLLALNLDIFIVADLVIIDLNLFIQVQNALWLLFLRLCFVLGLGAARALEPP